MSSSFGRLGRSRRGVQHLGLALCALGSALGLALEPASAQLIPAYKEAEGIDVVEHVDDKLPLGLRFVNERGVTVKLGDCFPGTKPIILTLNYSSCPMLCSLQLNGLVDALKEIEETAGDEFDLVTVSIDPRETWQLAAQTRKRYLGVYDRPAAHASWRFLTGEERDIRALADAVGFGYRFMPDVQQYVHNAVFMACTPDGRVSRYVYGHEIQPQTLRYSLIEAGEGRVGSAFERLLLLCYHYDSATGRYAPTAVALMRFGAGLTVLVLGLCLFGMWRREARRRRRAEVPA